MKTWINNRWGWTGVIIMLVLNGFGLLLIFPLITAFGALFLIGSFPIIGAISIPLIILGWFLGILAEKIWRKIK